MLTFADFRGFSEFGFIAGTGVLLALVAMTVVMPALIAALERTGGLNLDATSEAAGVRRAGRPFPAARGVVLGSLVAVVAALILLPRVEFEYDFGTLEPDYPEYDARNDVVREGVQQRRAPQPRPTSSSIARRRCQPSWRPSASRARTDTLSPTILDVESLQDRFPLTSEAQAAKLERVAEIRALLDDPFIEDQDTEELEKLRRAAGTTEPIALAETPESLRKPFTSKSGEVGNFVMIYPAVGLSDGRQSIAFSEDVGRVVTASGEVYHAGSTSLVAADMLRLMQREAPWMVLATFVIVVLLMWANFRSPPVDAAGAPAAGRGHPVDAAHDGAVRPQAQLLQPRRAAGRPRHRQRRRGAPRCTGTGRRGRARSGACSAPPASTSRWGSLTTMIGFGGLLLSFHPGLRSIGARSPSSASGRRSWRRCSSCRRCCNGSKASGHPLCSNPSR